MDASKVLQGMVARRLAGKVKPKEPKTRKPTGGVAAGAAATAVANEIPDVRQGALDPLTPIEEVARSIARDLIDGRSLRRVPKKKQRRHGISISVSQEEYDLLMTYGRSQGNFSEWARATLFRAMGHRIPARPKGD